MRRFFSSLAASKATVMLFAVTFLAAIASPASAQEYPPRYMGGPAKLTTAPNGAVINAEVLEVIAQNVYVEKTVEKVTDGVWVIGGYSIANCSVIEGPDGLIVYDTGDFREEGEHLREVNYPNSKL